MLKDYFLLTLLNYRQDYKLGTGIPVRAQRVVVAPRRLNFVTATIYFTKKFSVNFCSFLSILEFI